jgi:FkbM family methyltransferase
MIKELSFLGHPYKISCMDTIPNHPSWYSFEDEHIVRERNWIISPGDVVMDVGAAFGSYTLPALAQGAAFVWAWSPQGMPGEPPEADILLESLALNGWSDKCSIERSGVYSKEGWLDTVTQKYTFSKPINAPDYVIQVSTLDTWSHSKDLKKVDWMKFDVEGAELEVLIGGKNLISKFQPKIQVENHVFKIPTIESDVRQFLVNEMGYKEISTVKYFTISHSLYVHDRE